MGCYDNEGMRDTLLSFTNPIPWYASPVDLTKYDEKSTDWQTASYSVGYLYSSNMPDYPIHDTWVSLQTSYKGK